MSFLRFLKSYSVTIRSQTNVCILFESKWSSKSRLEVLYSQQFLQNTVLLITAVFSMLFRKQMCYFFLNKLHIDGLELILKQSEIPENIISLTIVSLFQPETFINTMLQSRSVKTGGTIGVAKATICQHIGGAASLKRASKVPWYAICCKIARMVRMRKNAKLIPSP